MQNMVRFRVAWLLSAIGFLCLGLALWATVQSPRVHAVGRIYIETSTNLQDPTDPYWVQGVIDAGHLRGSDSVDVAQLRSTRIFDIHVRAATSQLALAGVTDSCHRIATTL